MSTAQTDAETPPSSGSGYAFVRTEDAPRLPPPSAEVGLVGWLWRNVFVSMTNFSTPGAALQSIVMALATVFVAYIGFIIVNGLVHFALIDAVWTDPEGLRRLACATTLQGGQLPEDWYGACYPYISAKWQQFVYGRYPDEELWRVNLMYLLGCLGIAWIVMDSIPRRRPTGVALFVVGAAYGLLVASPDFYDEPFFKRVGVQIMMLVGALLALAPSKPPKRLIGALMLTAYPLLSFILLTGGDFEVGVGFWVWTLALFVGFAVFTVVARFGLLGEAGAAFSGTGGVAATLLAALLVLVFVSSSRFVDLVEVAGGATLSERETTAIDWWTDNNRIDTPLLATTLSRLGVERWGEAEVEALARSITADLEGVWDVDAAVASVDRFDDGLTAVQRFDVRTALERLAARPPSAVQIAQLGVETGVNVSEEELARLNAVSWSSSFLNVASSPGERLVWSMPPVQTNLWGGLLVTLIVAIVGIVMSLPLGVLLALGRRSSLPAIRILSIVFIEFWRGVPLITVLFMASVMLPLFLPPGSDFNLLVRALVGVMLFSAAYQAEVVRGGLQAIPKGQFEAADAIGLNYWAGMTLIVLPQALTLVIPGIVNTFIGLFKDTTLVSIISLFDLLGAVNTSFTDANWFVPTQVPTGFLVICVIYFLFCYGMSRYSLYMERQLRRGHAR